MTNNAHHPEPERLTTPHPQDPHLQAPQPQDPQPQDSLPQDSLPQDSAPPDATDPTPDAPPSPPSRSLSPAEREEALRLHGLGFGTRQIARKLQRSREAVRRVLQEDGLLVNPPPGVCVRPRVRASKLDPFLEQIREKVANGLTTRRILRELREQGYQGGRTILGKHVALVRAPLAPRSKKKVTRRFETAPAEELQFDWSSYVIEIAGKRTRVHALAVVLGYSRYAYVEFFDDERQPRLLEGLTHALEYFHGACSRGVSDNMATVVLARIGRDRKPLWNPRYLDFCRHYGFEPYVCKVAHPDRKGAIEVFLYFVERDFVRGTVAASLAELNRAARRWLDEIANVRTHGTTGLVPRELWLHERDFLVRLPDARFAGIAEEEVRRVGADATISVRGTLYTVPVRLANRSVAVRLYSEHFEVLEPGGGIAFTRAYVDPRDKGKLQLEPSHYDGLPYGPEGREGVARRLEEVFLGSYPTLAELLEGVTLRMKGLSHVHLRALLRLAERYGKASFLQAATRAQSARLFNANAVQRILERDCPLGPDEEPILPLGAAARVDALLHDVDTGDLDSYGHLDRDAGPDDAGPDDAGPDEDGPDEDAAGEGVSRGR